MSGNYLATVKKQVKVWEAEGPGYITQISDWVLYPAQLAAEKLIPDAVRETVETALRGCLEALLFGADFAFSDNEVLERVRELNQKLVCREAVQDSDDLESQDKAASHYWNWNLSYAVAQGGATGAGGLPGLAANIPALYTILFRMLQQMALCYGYDTTQPQEKAFLLHILQVGSCAELKSNRRRWST